MADPKSDDLQQDRPEPSPYIKRKPLRRSNRIYTPLSPGWQQPVVDDHQLLNRGTEQPPPDRATGEANKANTRPPAVSQPNNRVQPSPFEELRRDIDEEQSNRLNWMDGYNKTPPRPREGFGPELRLRYSDINEYFSGPAWYDVESSETRYVTPVPPYSTSDETYSDIGKPVRRRRPPPPPPVEKAPIPPPSDSKPTPPVTYSTKAIRFKKYSLLDAFLDNPHQFADPDYLASVDGVAKILRENPGWHVKIKASVGEYGPVPNALRAKVMAGRGKAVSDAIQARGIDPKRLHVEPGKVGTKDEDRNVDFDFFTPEP